MELNIGDLVEHKIHKEVIGFGIIISPSVPYKGVIACSVQWVETGNINIIDTDFLYKIAP